MRSRLVGILAGSALVIAGAPATALAQDPEPDNVVEITLPNRAELDRLVDLGTDLDHHVDSNDDGTLSVEAVITPSEAQELRARGFDVGDTTLALSAARSAAGAQAKSMAEAKQKNKALGGGIPLLVAESANLKVLRSDWYTQGTGQRLSIEAKSTRGAADVLTVRWDSGPQTAMGSGGTSTLNQFTDAGQYQYHRRELTVTARPNLVELSSSLTGETLTFNTREWGAEPTGTPGNPYLQNFQTSYLNPTQVYDKLEALAAEFPSISEIVKTPYLTNGYRRKSQAQFGTSAAAGSVVVVESKLYGSDGGNGMTAELKDPGAANATLSVTRNTRGVIVNLATDADGKVTSTAAQVVAAINATTGTPLRSFLYRGNAGAGVVAPGAVTLTDNLSAPANVSRDPFRVRALRIGGTRDGSKVGVFLYSQEHAREWQTPLVTLETAERLLRNYATDPYTKQLVDSVDIFVLPTVNPDGAHYSFFDSSGQRRNLFNYCGDDNSDPGRRNSWGVDVNRNYSEGSYFDGYSGGGGSCTGDTFSGPFEHSEPEARNVTWLADTFTNIKFSMNVHSSGNYFMWAPGAYKTPSRETMPYAPLVDEAYFWGSAGRVISAIKKWRNLAVTPARTGPVADVLYSAAGNSGDQLWYRNGIYAWDFEVGTSFMPNWTEANHEANEFANGLVELIDIARDYAHDGSTPASELLLSTAPGTAKIKFDANEPSSVYYNTAGQRPTWTNTTLYAAGGVREGGQTVTLTNTGSTPKTVTLTWFAVDSAGNIENNYKPVAGGVSDLYRRQTITIPPAPPGAPPAPNVVSDPSPAPIVTEATDTGTASEIGTSTLSGATANGVAGTGKPASRALDTAAQRKAAANKKAAAKKQAALKKKKAAAKKHAARKPTRR